MNKIKYLAAILIAVGGMGFQQAQANLLDPFEFTHDGPIGNPADELAFLQSNGGGIYQPTFLHEDCIFGAKFESGGAVEGDFSQFFTVSFSGNTATISWDLTGTGFQLGGVLIKDGNVGTGHIYRFYGVDDAQRFVGEDQIVGFDERDISHISFFVCPAGQVPDGGTTVMLLGAALGSLGMARRFLKK